MVTSIVSPYRNIESFIKIVKMKEVSSQQALFDKQILLVNTKVNVYRRVWRI